jgi:hypothetical protein
MAATACERAAAAAVGFIPPFAGVNVVEVVDADEVIEAGIAKYFLSRLINCLKLKMSLLQFDNKK